MPNIDACYRSIAADPSAQHEGQLSASNCRSGSHISWSLLAGSSPSLPDGSNPSAAIVQSASDVQCSRLLKTTENASIFGKICQNTRTKICVRNRYG
ncbi:MAG TPA: hypothetical protein DDZ09_11140 [Alcaligenes faecalis]|nr:hypothetical protein [Alcaligenes faecalis]